MTSSVKSSRRGSRPFNKLIGTVFGSRYEWAVIEKARKRDEDVPAQDMKDLKSGLAEKAKLLDEARKKTKSDVW